MIINFYGEGCFKIQDGDLVILTDPFDNKTGLSAPRFKADIILKTLTQFPIVNSQQITFNSQLISGPGEYNIKNIDIVGFALSKEFAENFLKTVYLIKAENVNLCFLGHISEMPEPAILERIEEVDILFIPAGGKPFIDQKSAVKLIKQIEPKIIIPTFYKIPDLKRKADNLQIFIDEFNHKDKIEPQEKLTIKKKDLNGITKTRVVVLKI